MRSDNKPQALSRVDERLLKGMNEEERKQFEGSYLRSKRVLTQLNAYASKEMESGLKTIESPEAMNVPNWDKLVAWTAGYRHAMRNMEKLTRT